MTALTSTELKLQYAILNTLNCRYQLANGEVIQGQSISQLSQELRYAGWKGVSNLYDLEDTCKRLGFTITRGQGFRWGGKAENDHRKLGATATVVTL